MLSNTHPALLGSTEPRINARCNNFVLRLGAKTYNGNQRWEVWAENDLTTLQWMHRSFWLVYSLILLFEVREIILASLKLK